MAESFMALAAILTAAIFVLAVVAWPVIRLARQRHRIELERQLVQWQLRAITRSALGQMLNEARRPRGVR